MLIIIITSYQFVVDNLHYNIHLNTYRITSDIIAQANIPSWNVFYVSGNFYLHCNISLHANYTITTRLLHAYYTLTTRLLHVYYTLTIH